jgi:hypothetical protein
VAAHNVPPEVQRLLEILVGNDWPEGNEGDLRAMAAGWRDLAGRMQRITEDAQTAAASVAQGVTGQVLGAFESSISPIISENGYLAGLTTTCAGLADALESVALEIETLRILIIEQLIFLAAQIAADIAAAAFTFGESLTLIEPEMLATRAFVTMLIRKTIVVLVTHLTESVANQTVTTFTAQFIEFCQGRRSSFDAGQIALAAQNGAIGGAVGFGLGNLGGFAKTGFGKLTQHRIPIPATGASVPGAVNSFANGAVKTSFDVGWGAASGAAEAAAQDAAVGGSGDEVFGAENGAFSGGRDRFHSTVNPHDTFSVSAGHYLDKGINAGFDGKRPRPPGTPPPVPPQDAGPPILETPPPEDWNAWSDDVLNTVDHRLRGM